MNSRLARFFSLARLTHIETPVGYGAVLLLSICMVACGGSGTSPTDSSTGNTCSGVVISGVLQDSLTNQPISRGWAVLESGTQRSIAPVYDFFPTRTATTDVNGAFRLCSPTLKTPAALVVVALDASGNAYPSFVTAVSGSINLGAIPIGMRGGICGFDGQQTAPPATISGVIASTPIAKSGQVWPQYPMSGLDG